MKICLVTTDLMGFVVNGGVGTANFHLAQYLAPENQVDILFVHEPKSETYPEYMAWKNEYQKLSINVLSLDYPTFQIESQYLFLTRSYVVYLNLRKSKYDLIIFPEMHGLGHYSFLAKKLHLGFDTTKLVTMYHGPSEWHHRFNKGLPSTYSELVKFYIEKQSCLNCDHIYFATQHAKKVATELGYFKADQKQSHEILMYPFDTNPIDVDSIDAKKMGPEICFFGRVESRKGIEVFLNAIKLLSEKINIGSCKITIMGKLGAIKSQDSFLFLRNWSSDHKIFLNLLNDFSTLQAFEYIKKNRVLVILPSVEETMGYALIESIVNRAPIICSDIPPFLEVIKNLQANDTTTFESNNAKDLANQIFQKLKNSSAPSALKLKSNIFLQKWNASINKLKSKNSNKKRVRNNLNALSICVVYFDRPLFLNQLLFSLTELSPCIDEILIYINKNESVESKKLLEKLRKKGQVTLIQSKTGVSPGAARNFLASRARNENLLFIDDDNLLAASVIKRIIETGFNDWDIICSPLKKFNNIRLKDEAFAHGPQHLDQALEEITEAHWIPIGAEMSLNIIENKIGDCNFLVKKTHLRSMNGFDESLLYGEDQDFLLRSVYKNARYFLCPEAFVYYRYHRSNLTRKVDHRIESIKSMELILNGLGLSQFVPLFQLVRAWEHEKDRNPDWPQLGRIYDYSGEKSVLHERKTIPFMELGQYLQNKTTVFPNKNLAEVQLLRKAKSTALDTRADKRLLVLHIFSKIKLDVLIKDKTYNLKRGHTQIEVLILENERVAIQGPAATSVYIFDAVEIIKPRPMPLMLALAEND